MPIGVYTRTEDCNRIHYEAQNCPKAKEKHRIATIEAHARSEVKKKHREAGIKMWKDLEYRKKRKESLKEAMIRVKSHPDHDRRRRMNSEARKKNWKDPKFVKKQMRARGVKPNKTELNLNKFLHRILPNEYKFVGDGEFILAGKCPDFVNVNGQKKIIELYGNYWHKGETGQKRITLFRQYGYETLIIWENELEDEIALKEKILNFNGEQNDK